MTVKIIGNFVDKDGDKTYAGDVFVALDQVENSRGDLAIYTPTFAHCTASPGYIEECEKITKEEYLAASKGYYTPEDYLKEEE